ncbi:hypothetical protein [Luteimonas sp. gir]|uniref:hypothetical protein n=1 Tax=Luteimonas sp. gir TaxID=3127960 RepID=UPI003075C13E
MIGRRVAALAVITLSACTSDPRVSLHKVAADRWTVEVVRCGPDPEARRVREDVEAIGSRRCPRGHLIESSEADLTWLGSLIGGECQATRLRATVVCKGAH